MEPLRFCMELTIQKWEWLLAAGICSACQLLGRLMNIFPISPSHSSVINIVETMHMPQFSAVR